jgi:bleomycin resistance family protein
MQVSPNSTTDVAKDPAVNMKPEVIVIPVSDVDHAQRFYRSLGWRLDADIVTDRWCS